MPLRQLGKLGVGSLPSSMAVGRAQREEVCAGSKEENWPGQARPRWLPALHSFCPEAPWQTHQGIKELPLLTVSVFRFRIEMAAVGTLGHGYS